MTTDRMMRAAWYERTGPAEQVFTIGEMPTPTPGAGQVLVRVAMSGINPHDTKRRSGWTGGELPAARMIPHFDAAGTIAAVGAGVAELTRLMQAGWLQHPRAHVFPLDRIAEAHAALESGRIIGKVLVSCQQQEAG